MNCGGSLVLGGDLCACSRWPHVLKINHSMLLSVRITGAASHAAVNGGRVDRHVPRRIILLPGTGHDR